MIHLSRARELAFMRTHFVLLISLALLGCAGPERAPGPRAGTAPSTAQRAPSKDELRRLRELAEIVVVGTVETYDDPQTGRIYTVRVNEVLSRHPDVEARAETHPVKEGDAIKVAAFLFRPGAGSAEVGVLDELSRYVFFLSPTEDAGEWLNLEDAAAHRLPEAQATLDTLRLLRDAPAPGRSPSAG